MKGDTLRKKIKGEREWRPKELSKIGDALNIPKSHLLGEDIRPFEPPQPIITVLGTQANILPGVKTEDYLAVPLVEGPIAAGYAGAIPGDYVRGLVWVYRPEIGKRQHHNLESRPVGQRRPLHGAHHPPRRHCYRRPGGSEN